MKRIGEHKMIVGKLTMKPLRKSGCAPYRRSAANCSRRAGFTLIEVLCAAVIVGVCLAAIVTTWSVSFTIAGNADRASIGYTLGRRALEEVKETGFQDSTEGTSTVYYDGSGGNRSTVASNVHTYSVVTTVATDVMNGAVPASTALRTVSVTVTVRSTGATVYTCSTYLARAGI